MHSSSFPPIVTRGSSVLVLGSMPGQASLQAQQYYAHPRNAFWAIMCGLLQGQPQAPYAERVRLLQQGGVAVWDVMQSCFRPGSLDADIDEASIVPNDFCGLLDEYSNIKAVFFNGAKAEHSFRRYVSQEIGSKGERLHFQRLPSTSPAHAAMSLEQKREAWADIMPFLQAAET